MEHLHILTIDDDRVIQSTIKNLITKNFIDDDGFTPKIHTRCAMSIKEVRKIMKNSIIENTYFDIAFLDLSIDKKDDGFEIIPIIKHFFPSCFVVIVSADDSIGTLQKADAAGASGYIKKPFSAFSGRIIEIIQRVSKLRELEAG